MKKIMIGIIIIIIAVLAILATSLYSEKVKKDELATEYLNKISELNNKVEVLEKEMLNTSEEVKNNDVEDGSNNTTAFTFNANKMKVKDDAAKYSAEANDCGILVNVSEGKVKLSTFPSDDTYSAIFSNKKEISQEITGFSGKVGEVYIAKFGNGANAPKILFLMEDGSVEYADSAKIINNGNYKSEGKIQELSNIVKFIDVSRGSAEEGMGDSSVVAIDKDGYAYDLYKILEK